MVNCGCTHFKQNLIDQGNQLSTKSILPALREYNSGSVIQSDLSDAPNCVGNPFVSPGFYWWRNVRKMLTMFENRSTSATFPTVSWDESSKCEIYSVERELVTISWRVKGWRIIQQIIQHNEKRYR
jgi:hypothetical protein